MMRRTTSRLVVLHILIGMFLVVGCDETPTNTDPDGTVGDQGTKLDGQGPGQEGGTPDGPAVDGPLTDTGPKPDQQVVTYKREVTLGHHDGIHALKLQANPLTEGRLLVKVPAKLLPVEVRKISFKPPSAYSAKLLVAPDSMGTPGGTLLSQNFTIKSTDVDKNFSIDISSSKVQVTGNFWVIVQYPSSHGSLQETIYGGSSSSGQNIYKAPGYPLYTTNFDPIMEVLVGTPDAGPAATKGGYNAACSSAFDCNSGFCAGGACSKTCNGNSDCGAQGRCQTFADGAKICVTTCSKNSDCKSNAICLTDATFIKTAGLCVLAGPFAAGKSCQYQYHTICKTGYCSACATDPTKCDKPGTCTNKP
jgi:hypothetical protein